MAINQVVQFHDPALRLPEEHCPVCDQSITVDKFREIRGKLEAEDLQARAEIRRTLSDELSLTLEEERKVAAGRERELREEHERLKIAGAARESAAREEGRTAAELAAAVEREELANAKAAAEALALEEKTAREQELRAAGEREATLRAEAEQLKVDASTRESAAREEGRTAAELAAAAEREELANAKAAAEALALEEKTAREQELRAAGEREATLRAEAEQLKVDASTRESAAREEGRTAAELAAAAEREELANAKAAAEALALEEKTAREQELRAAGEREATLRAEAEQLKEQAAINEAAALLEQREALEKSNDEKLNIERAKHFDETLKIQTKLAEAQRQLEKASSYELGEGAEVDLYEVLKETFDKDEIQRVDKGEPGADIIHDVVFNGTICGRIVYDSKNRKAWRSEFVSKLRDDQIAAKANHSVLSSSVFPSGSKQLHNSDGVIIANPARVSALVEILRNQLIHMHELRVSNDEREAKTAALYEFITSEQCRQMLDSIETLVRDLETIDVDETKAHTKVWSKRGKLLRRVLQAQGMLRFEIDTIVGTATPADAEDRSS